MPTCIYCTDPGEPSEAHIIPDVLGKGPTLQDGVCKKCNNATNREFEQKLAARLSLFRHFLQIDGRRGRPAIEVHSRLSGLDCTIKVRRPADLDSSVLVFADRSRTEGQPRRVALVASSEASLVEARQSFQERHPSARWSAMPDHDLADLEFQVEWDASVLADAMALRLAAKVALEWWCFKRGPDAVSGPEFEPIKHFVMTGVRGDPALVCIATNPKLIRALNHIPFGLHSLLVATHPPSPRLVVYFGLFSLLWYKVVLAERYPVFAILDDLALIHPQTGEVYVPPIRTVTRPPDLASPQPDEAQNPMDVVLAIKTSLMERVNAAFSLAASQVTIQEPES